MDYVAIQKALQDFVVSCTGLSDSKVYWARQAGVRPAHPAIYMKLALIDDHGMPWIDTETNTLSITPLVISSVSGDEFTTTTHGRATGDGPFQFTGADLPLGVSEDTNYWLVVTGATTFKVATSFQNAKAATPTVVTLGDTGSGVMTLSSTDATLAAGAELNYIQRSLLKATLTLTCFATNGVGIDMAEAILWRINSKRLLPSINDALWAANIGIIEVDRVRTIGGTQDLVIFEPRAMLDIQLHLTSEETETGGMIESTEIENETYPDNWVVDGSITP